MQMFNAHLSSHLVDICGPRTIGRKATHPIVRYFLSEMTKCMLTGKITATNGDWTDDGPCTAGAAAHLQSATSSFEPTSTFTISDTTEGALTSASFVSSSATSVTSAEIDASTSAKRVRSRFFQL